MAGAVKRILFIQTQAENAGAQEISRLLARELEARGHDTRHLFFYRKTDGFDRMAKTLILCHKRPGNPIAFLRFCLALIRAIRAIRPDIVFTFQHFGNVFGAPAARLAGVRCIVANQVSARETIHPLVRLLDRFIGQTPVYSRITINSHNLMGDYRNFPQAYRRKLVLVPHGFEDKTLDLGKRAARERLGLAADKPLLGTVARLNEGKQIDRAIGLLTHRADWHLAIAGQGPDLERLQTITRALGLTDRVHFLGERAQSEIGLVLAALDVFVFPTRAETFGLAAVEAGQAGVPIVANDLPVLREVLAVDGEACAVLVDVNDEAAFAKAVETILANPALARQMSERARGLKRKYSLGAMVDAYEAMVLNETRDPVLQIESAVVS